MQDRQLASLGDAFVNFVYSLALTQISGHPKGIKVSDRDLSEAFRVAGLREFLGTRLSKKDLANASESLLVRAYQTHALTIEESVQVIAGNPDGPKAGLAELLRLAVTRLSGT
jgi:hypothetical protein